MQRQKFPERHTGLGFPRRVFDADSSSTHPRFLSKLTPDSFIRSFIHRDRSDWTPTARRINRRGAEPSPPFTATSPRSPGTPPSPPSARASATSSSPPTSPPAAWTYPAWSSWCTRIYLGPQTPTRTGRVERVGPGARFAARRCSFPLPARSTRRTSRGWSGRRRSR